MKKIFYYASLALLLFVPMMVFAEEYSGKVITVTAGDSLSVMRGAKPEKIRLYGILCPREGQPFEAEAKQMTMYECYSQLVNVQVASRAGANKTYAVIILPDGRSLNDKLLRAGYAWWDRKSAPNEESLRAYEEDARINKRGIWANTEFVNSLIPKAEK